MIDYIDIAIMGFALFPLATLLSIWMLEYIGRKLIPVAVWVVGSIGLWVMGRDI